MSRILLAAHDRGGANLLLQVFYKVIDKQHDVRFVSAADQLAEPRMGCFINYTSVGCVSQILL